MRLILGNDQRLCMDALAAALSQHGVTVAAVARTPHDVLTAVAEHKPDICLLAARCSVGNGVDLIRAIRAHSPAVKVVILTDGSNCSVLTAAAQVGAAALVSRRQRIPDLIALLQRVLGEERPVDVDSTLAETITFGPPVDRDCDPRLGHLTVREHEVLMHMIEGQATKEIARSLAITVHTARTHAQSVLAKLGAHSRLEASGMMARRGLLDPSAAYPAGRAAQPTGASR